MTFEELSTVRYTQRSYDSKPVEDDKIQKILQAGRVPPPPKTTNRKRSMLFNRRRLWISCAP